MNVIKNFHKIVDVLSEDQITQLKAKANWYFKNDDITFKILSVSENAITVLAIQGKRFSDSHANGKSLTQFTDGLFRSFFPKKTVNVELKLFEKPISEVVTPEWLKGEMKQCGIKLKNFVDYTGIDKSNISAWVNGIRPMSSTVKVLLFNVVKQFAIKKYFIFLNSDVPALSIFTIKRYFDEDLIKGMLVTNVNARRYKQSFKINYVDYVITLENEARRL